MTKTITTNHNEESWVILGNWEDQLWWGRMRKMTNGEPCLVDFQSKVERLLKREEVKGDIIGFYHTHPGFSATPSSRDDRTMGAWVNCFGKSLLCVIKGVDGVRGYWYDNDEDPPVECQVKRFGSLLVGTTEYVEEEEHVAEDT